jgi:riboflavin synthase
VPIIFQTETKSKTMFTGIIKEVGRVDEIRRTGSLIKLGIESAIISNEASPSDSIAVNGVCLTLTKKDKNILFFEAIASTLKTTNLKRLKKRDYLNLEPALKLGEKMGGHFVLGHVDSEAKLRRIVLKGSYRELEVELPSQFRKFIVENGSITIEGVSLTVKKVLPRVFTANIVPFTYDNTNLKVKKAGDWLNLEFDYLLKQKSESKK